MITSKRCPRCKTTQPIEAFAVDRTKASGHKSACKACDALRSAEYYGLHRQQVLATARAARAARRAARRG